VRATGLPTSSRTAIRLQEKHPPVWASHLARSPTGKVEQPSSFVVRKTHVPWTKPDDSSAPHLCCMSPGSKRANLSYSWQNGSARYRQRHAAATIPCHDHAKRRRAVKWPESPEKTPGGRPRPRRGFPFPLSCIQFALLWGKFALAVFNPKRQRTNLPHKKTISTDLSLRQSGGRRLLHTLHLLLDIRLQTLDVSVGYSLPSPA